LQGRSIAISRRRTPIQVGENLLKNVSRMILACS
jgi:hypothetical protein